MLNISTLLATCETKVNVKIGIIFIGFGMFVSYFFIASKNAYLPRLQLGSWGVGYKNALSYCFAC